MKQLFTKLAILCVPIIITSIALATIDPYNIFHYKNIRENGVEPNKNYIKTRYILDNHDKFNALLFGSSRVGGIDVGKISVFNCYNMTYSEGIPIEHYENLELMIHNGFIPDLVLIGVDDICNYATPEFHKTQWLRIPHPSLSESNTKGYLKFFSNYFNPVLLSSLPIIITHNNATDEASRKYFYANGGRRREDEKSNFNWENARSILSRYITRIDEAIKNITKIIDICNKNNIKLIVFTNPIHVFTYKNAVYNGYLDFLYKLSDSAEFYNFSGISDITTNNDNYLETSHYIIQVGDIIINTIFDNEVDGKLLSQGFGYYVTKENRNDFIDLLKGQIEK
jgi:hypothetical protein